MPTVVGKIRTPAGAAATGDVKFRLVGSNGVPLTVAWLPGSDEIIEDVSTVTLDGTGSYSISLPSNDLIVPAGSRWSRKHDKSGAVTLYVTQSPATQREEDILADPPGTLATAALDTAVAELTDQSTLESIGAAVDQTTAQTVANRWLALIRNTAGIRTSTGITYTGGDVTDAVLQNNGNVTWTLADFFPSLTVDADDSYGSTPIGPYRNGAVYEIPSGTFTGGATSDSAWLDAVTEGGLTGLWWPLTIVEDNDSPRATWVLCWHNDAAITASNPFGAYLDTHIVKLGGFGTFDSKVVCGFTDQKFFAECARLSSPYIFVLGGEFHPQIDGLGSAGYAQPSDLPSLRAQQDMTHRLARASSTAFENVGAWEYWTGSGWSTTRANAVELTDTNGQVINGSAGFAQVKTGLWLLVAHHMVDTHLDVFRFEGSAPTGPWTPVARVPLPSAVGRAIEGGVQIAWHCKVIPHLSAPAEHSIASLTAWPKGLTSTFTDRNVRRYAPIFVTVPWF